MKCAGFEFLGIATARNIGAHSIPEAVGSGNVADEPRFSDQYRKIRHLL